MLDEEVTVQEYSVEDFMKPRCPVKVGDIFYKKYHVPNTLNKIIVEKIEEAKDGNGFYYLITGRAFNIAIGVNVRKYDSRMLTPENYVIEKKGVDF